MRPAEYAFGVDVSSTMQLELNGMVFKENGQAKPALEIFKEHSISSRGRCIGRMGNDED
jgi:arabinogalactan endo-1,4-beta-galactosidase